MKPETIYKSLEYLPDEYLDSAHTAMEKGKRPMGWRRTLLIAACVGLAVVMAVVPIASYIQNSDLLIFQPTVELSLQEIDSLFDHVVFLGDSNSNTSNYSSIDVTDPKYLYLNDIPQTSYLPIYTADRSECTPNKEEFLEFAEPRIQRLTNAMNVKIDQIIKSPNSLVMKIEGFTQTTNRRLVNIHAKQENGSQLISVYPKVSSLQLEGEKIQICLSDSDEEIAASMGSIREKFNAIFDESFSDTMVCRIYDPISDRSSNTTQGVVYRIYFYNRSDHPSNEWVDSYTDPYTDYISIQFEIVPYDANSTAMISDIASIRYTKSSIPMDELYQVTGKAKMLSLEEAEKLLAQGICFADTARFCSFCHPTPQPTVDFTDYDYVSFVYRFDKRINRSQAIPFYVFYKYTGKTEHGLSGYAYTYVPAIEVTGLEEYFRS